MGVKRPPRATRLGRLSDYLGQMFPLPFAIPAGLLGFAGIWFGLQALDGRAPLHIGWRAPLAAATTILFSLLLRLYDEIKDVETDLRLGKAGDPRYKDRAIVTGHVQPADLLALRNGVIALLVAVNLPLGAPLPLAAFAVMLLLAWLSSRWFFWPSMSRHLLVAFITHNPLMLALTFYVVAVYVKQFDAHPPPHTFLFALGLWLQVAAWEVARKVRRPAEETDYTTYSKVLGWPVAAILPVLLLATSTLCLSIVARRVGLGLGLPAALWLATCLMLVGTIEHFVSKAPSTRLRILAEIYAVASGVGVPLALVLRFKLALAGAS